MASKVKCLILMILLLAGVAGCGEKIEPGTRTGGSDQRVKAPITVAQVTQEPFFYEAVATISARTAGTVSSKLMGSVLAVHVREGDAVQKDQVLVTLDARQVDAQADQAQAALKGARRDEAAAMSARDAAKASADLAGATYRRYEQLRKENTISQQAFEETESRYRQAQAAMAQSEAMLEAARSRIAQAEAGLREVAVAQKDAVVQAPYDGRVAAKMVDEGDLASPGMPLFTIEQEGVYCADLVLPERYIQSVALNSTVNVVVQALGDQPVSGTVGRIVPTADPQSRSFEVKVAMPEGLELKSGMFARVFIPLGGTGIIAVPQTAIVEQGQLTGLFVLDDRQIARFRLVRIGKTFGERVEIISGLYAGQKYVSAVPATLTAGVVVEAAP